jgi:hypothetical protein
MKLTGPQIAAAISLVGMTRESLCKEAAISKNTLIKILNNDAAAYRQTTISKIRDILESHSAEFIDNQGVRMKSSGVFVYEGPERFGNFSDFVYEQVKSYGGSVCLSVSDERLFLKYRTPEATTTHYERMQKLYDSGILKSFRILAHHSDFGSKYSYTTYRQNPKASIAPTAFYTFSDCLALISFAHNPAPYIVVLQSEPIVKTYTQAFDTAWELASTPSLLKEE